jgi:hypothetical protein
MFSGGSALVFWRTLANQTVSMFAGLAHRADKTEPLDIHIQVLRGSYSMISVLEHIFRCSCKTLTSWPLPIASLHRKPFRMSLYEVKQSKASPPEGREHDANHATQQR